LLRLTTQASILNFTFSFASNLRFRLEWQRSSFTQSPNLLRFADEGKSFDRLLSVCRGLIVLCHEG